MYFSFSPLHRPICLTSKCMHTSLPSLRPPQSGGAVRGFAAAVSCYDVKTTTPLSSPPFPLVHVPHSPSLDPQPAVPLPAPCHRAHAGLCRPPPPPPPFGAAERGREPNNATGTRGNFSQKNIPEISPPHRTVHAQKKHTHTGWLLEECQNIPGLCSAEKNKSDVISTVNSSFSSIEIHSNTKRGELYSLLSILTQITVVASKMKIEKAGQSLLTCHTYYPPYWRSLNSYL